jgi:hypothetical protein
MKLYTEEEIVSFLKREFSDEINAETFMENLAPIELPIDEEIEKQAPFSYESSSFKFGVHCGYLIGAKSIRDKIQGGNK